MRGGRVLVHEQGWPAPRPRRSTSYPCRESCSGHSVGLDRAIMAVMDPAERAVRNALAETGIEHEVVPCDPELADTAAFCRAYGYPPEDTANTIVVAGKADPPAYVACVVLATTRLDVNRVVRARLGVRKASFADAEATRALTGMEIGGVSAIGLPPELAVWVDARVMQRPRIVLGGGSRRCKIVGPPALLTARPGVEVVEGLAVEVAPGP